jgi:hypothetical protein
VSSLSAIRAGLVTNLNPLKASYRDMQISPYVLSNPTPPVIWVKPGVGNVTEYHQSMETVGNPDGQFTWTMTVQAFVAGGGDKTAQILLDELLDTRGTHSVKAAIEADKTLGGAAEDLIVRRCISYQEYQRPDGSIVLGAEWIVEVS